MRSSGTYEDEPSQETTSSPPKQPQQKRPTKFRERMRKWLQSGKNNGQQDKKDVPKIFDRILYQQADMTAFNNNDNGEGQDITNNFFLPDEDESGPLQSSVKTFLTGNNDDNTELQPQDLPNQNQKQSS